MKETEKVPFDSMPPLIRGLFLTKEQVEKLKEPFKDVVSVVRCKDCKFRQSRIFRIIDGKECNLCERVKGYKPADWYCADGKRR